MEKAEKPITVLFNGKYLVRDRIIAMYTSERKIFPYLKPFQSFCFIWRFPFIKQYSFPLNIWITRHCVEVLMDSGKIFRKWCYDEGPNGYSSPTNAERELSQFSRNFEYTYPSSRTF